MGQRLADRELPREHPAHIACSVKTKEPVKAMDGPTWSMDLTFASDVLSGKPLAVDGEALGRAFLALRIEGNDLAKILALLTPEQVKS